MASPLSPEALRRIMETHADELEGLFGPDWRSMSFFSGTDKARPEPTFTWHTKLDPRTAKAREHHYYQRGRNHGTGTDADAMPGGPGLKIDGLEVWLGGEKSRNPLHHKAYRMTGEDYRVQAAAQAYREALELERRYFIKVGADGKRVYQSPFFTENVPGMIERLRSRLRFRMVRVLKEQMA